MTDVLSLAQIVLVVAAIVVPFVAAVRQLAGWEPFDGLGPARPEWPAGVQEEDPAPWRFRSAAA